MSSERVTRDMVDALQEGVTLGRASAAQLRERAETEYAWGGGGDDAAAFELEPGLERARVLALAAEDFLAAGDADRALAVAQEARAAAGPADYTAHPTLVEVHLGRDEPDVALAVADEARKAAASDPALAEAIGDVFELAGLFADAERWYTIGLRGASRVDGRFWYERLLRDRHRVRRDQGKEPDAMDDEYEKSE
ncbi:MAG TPA: hypothetical protein VGC45_10675 [Gryllotalpicola sp.]